MMIKNSAELNLFEICVRNCQNPVLVLTPEGKQYNLKKPSEYLKGIVELMRPRRNRMEPEVYTNCGEDDLMFYDYFQKCSILPA